MKWSFLKERIATTMKLIPIDQIDPNPYQPRQAMDQEALESLARGIKIKRATLPDTCGLMQVPMGRLVDGGRVQLAFGHRRLEAFRHLYRTDGSDWLEIPLELAELSDEDMYDFAARENGDRADINDIEKAKSIQQAQEKFGWTLQRAASAHGLSKSAASNLTRLLLLPAPVQALVVSGELGQRHARELVKLVQLKQFPVEKVSEIAHQAAYEDMPVAQLEQRVNDIVNLHTKRQDLIASLADKTTCCPDCDSPNLYLMDDDRIVCGSCENSWAGKLKFDMAWGSRREWEEKERRRKQLDGEAVIRYCRKCNLPGKFNALAVEDGALAECPQCSDRVILYTWLKTPRIYRPLYLGGQKPSDDRKPAAPWWTKAETGDKCYVCGQPAVYHNWGNEKYPGGADFHLCEKCYTKNLEAVTGIDFDDALKSKLDQIKKAGTFDKCQNEHCSSGFTVPNDTMACKKCGAKHREGMTGPELIPGEQQRLDEVRKAQTRATSEGNSTETPTMVTVFPENGQPEPTKMDQAVTAMKTGSWGYTTKWDKFICLVCGKEYTRDDDTMELGRWYDADSRNFSIYTRNLCTRCYPVIPSTAASSKNDNGDLIVTCYKCGSKVELTEDYQEPVCIGCGTIWDDLDVFEVQKKEYDDLQSKLQIPLPLVQAEAVPEIVFPENGNGNGLEYETTRFRSQLQTRINALVIGAGLSQLVEFDAWLDDAAREIFGLEVEVLA